MTCEVQWAYNYLDWPLRSNVPCSEEQARAKARVDHSVRVLRREVVGGVPTAWFEVDDVERPS